MRVPVRLLASQFFPQNLDHRIRQSELIHPTGGAELSQRHGAGLDLVMRPGEAHVRRQPILADADAHALLQMTASARLELDDPGSGRLGVNSRSPLRR